MWDGNLMCACWHSLCCYVDDSRVFTMYRDSLVKEFDAAPDLTSVFLKASDKKGAIMVWADESSNRKSRYLDWADFEQAFYWLILSDIEGEDNKEELWRWVTKKDPKMAFPAIFGRKWQD